MNPADPSGWGPAALRLVVRCAIPPGLTSPGPRCQRYRLGHREDKSRQANTTRTSRNGPPDQKGQALTKAQRNSRDVAHSPCKPPESASPRQPGERTVICGRFVSGRPIRSGAGERVPPTSAADGCRSGRWAGGVGRASPWSERTRRGPGGEAATRGDDTIYCGGRS